MKFNASAHPKHVWPHERALLKQEILNIAKEMDVKLFISLIHHSVANDPNDPDEVRSIKQICYHFDCFLGKESKVGLVLLDHFSDKKLKDILREQFMVGIKGLPYSDALRFDRVLGFYLATIGSSHFISLVDAIRHIINERNNPAAIETMLAQLKPIFVKNDLGKVEEISLFFKNYLDAKKVNY